MRKFSMLLVLALGASMPVTGCGGGGDGGATPTATATLMAGGVPTAATATLMAGGVHTAATGMIAFAANLTGEETELPGGVFQPNFEIYTAHPDGGGLTRLTEDLAVDSQPQWSPDGSRIVFFSTRSGNGDIYVMKSDGSGLIRLTDVSAQDYSPAWSPDGGRIVYISVRDGDSEIYVMNADGTGQTNLSNDPSDDFYGVPVIGLTHPNPWSPDGRRVAFNRGSLFGDDGNSDLAIYVASADDSGLTRVVDDALFFFGWSPDGERILYASASGEGAAEVYISKADGSGRISLISLPGGENPLGFPVWSPDGERIALTADRNGEDAVYVVNVDGSGLTPLTTGGCDGLYGTVWSSDSRRIAFTRGCSEGRSEVWVVNADGTGEMLVAGTGHLSPQPWFPAFAPVWSPVP